MANYRDPQQTLLIKTKVLYAAAKLFLQKGFSETTVKEIAQEAGVYTYKMAEAIGNAAYIDYDETTYMVAVTVVDNGNGALVIESITVNGETTQNGDLEIVFHNRYTEPEPPKTGDETKATAYVTMALISIIALSVLVIGKKKQWLA